MIANYFIPLNDTTEARYGEIARKMLETGNWVTLQHDYGVPFWAKPPLSTWLSASSMSLFGINEFAVRLPALLLALASLWLIYYLAKQHSSRPMAVSAVLVLAGSFFFFLNAGVVMTDPALVFCTTLCFVAFWCAVAEGSKPWSYVIFLGLGLGLLAKGPIALVLVGGPLFIWVLIGHRWYDVWHRLPWITGSVILCAVALPWYALAEHRTPGFLNYFIVGEHLQRFLTPGWNGDKYGFAHYAPKGIIWLYALVGIFPWGILGGSWLLRHGKTLPGLCKDKDGWMSYLIIFMLFPLIFFTFASNIIYPYVFPALPAFALFFAEVWQRSNPTLKESLFFPRWALTCGVVALTITFAFIFKPEWVAASQKEVINAWHQRQVAAEKPLLYWKHREFSAEFYARGKVKTVNSESELCTIMANNQETYLVINAQEIGELSRSVFAQFTLVDTIPVKKDKMLLVHAGQGHCLK